MLNVAVYMKWAFTGSALSLRRWAGQSRHWNREKSGLQTTLTTRVYAYTNTGVLINERRPASPESIYQQTTTTVSKDQICPSAIRSRRVSRWQTSADTRVRSVAANFSLASRRRVSWQPHKSGAWVRVTGGGQSRRRAKWDLPALNGWQQQLTSFIGWFVDWKLQCCTKFVLPMFWEREHFRRVIYIINSILIMILFFVLFCFSFSNKLIPILLYKYVVFWHRFQMIKTNLNNKKHRNVLPIFMVIQFMFVVFPYSIAPSLLNECWILLYLIHLNKVEPHFSSLAWH